MAKAKAATPAEELEVGDVTSEDVEFMRFIEEEGGNFANVHIYRLTSRGDLEGVGVSSVDGMSEEYIRETYGAPATYVLKFKGSDGRFKATKKVKLGLVKIGTPEPHASGSGVPAVATAMQDLLTLQLKMSEQRASEQASMINTLLAGLVNRPQVSTPDPSAMLAAVVSAFAALKGAAGESKAVDPFEHIERVVSLVRDLGGNGGGGDQEESVWGVLKSIGGKVIDAAAPAIEHLARGAVAGTPSPHVATMQQAQRVALPAAENPGGEMPKGPSSIAEWIKVGLAYLKAKALAGKDPELFIEYVFENQDEPQNAALIGALRQGATFDHLLQFDADIAQNPVLLNWFQEFYNGLHRELSGNGDGALDTRGPSGDAGNNPGDAKTSAPGQQHGGGPVAGE